MIRPEQVSQLKDLSTEAYLEELKKIEQLFDHYIQCRKAALLKGERLYFTIHDSENKCGALGEVSSNYSAAGWCVARVKPWSALFTEITLSMPPTS